MRAAFDAEAGADPRLLTFLDRLSEPLERTLSPEALAAFRLQALGHLEMLAEEIADEERLSPGESVERALREYGQPDLLAIAYLDEWCKGARPVGFAKGARSAYLWSFVWFGFASAGCLVALQVTAMWPGMGGFDPAVWGLALVAPIVAGVLTGLTVPTGNLRAVMVALAILVVHSTLVAEIMLPFHDGARLGLLQLFAWPQLGGAATYLTALLRRRPSISNRHRRLA